MNEAPYYDVIIAGGGLAGLSLARQLRRHGPARSILVLDRLPGPLPEAAFKVGESTVEVGTHYYAESLGLRDYLDQCHIGKLGLRFFYPSDGDFASRPELGVADWLPARAYQLDRGRLENKLRELVLADGIDFEEGVVVQDVQLAEDDSTPHTVVYSAATPGAGAGGRTARCRWLVDATGRRRLVQKKLGLSKPLEGVFSSAWFRLRGKLTVDDFVPPTETEWHERVRPDRWFSTNHLMGKGYWIWLIPLSSGNTSVGIVATEELHPFSEFGTFEHAMAFLARHEPVLAEFVKRHEPMDFRTMRDYSYSSHQVFSVHRWSCTGEAGVFVDPYYSVGLNMIAFSNGLTQRMIDLDFAGEPVEEFVDHANRFFLSLIEALEHNIHVAYPFYDRPQIMCLKTVWDFCVGWGIADPQLYHGLYLDPKMSNLVSGIIARTVRAQARLVTLFKDWVAHPDGCRDFRFTFVDYLADLPSISELYRRNLPAAKTTHEVLTDLRYCLDRLEELAHVIFFLAVEDTMPDQLDRFRGLRWVDVCAISLDSSRWEADGLFRPPTPPRDYRSLESEIRGLFRFERAKAYV